MYMYIPACALHIQHRPWRRPFEGLLIARHYQACPHAPTFVRFAAGNTGP